jgi:hypothetical protein
MIRGKSHGFPTQLLKSKNFGPAPQGRACFSTVIFIVNLTDRVRKQRYSIIQRQWPTLLECHRLLGSKTQTMNMAQSITLLLHSTGFRFILVPVLGILTEGRLILELTMKQFETFFVLQLDRLALTS